MTAVITEIVFITAMSLVFFAYFGYPLTLLAIALSGGGRGVRNSGITPSVTVVIAAYNEEGKIEAKLENTLVMEYPGDKLQIIVVSDGSTDSTNRIVGEYANRGVEIVETTGRVGKEGAQLQALPHARGEIIVFTDVATLSDINCIKNMVRNFADDTVGCVSSEDRVIKNGKDVGGEGAYVRYEMWIRNLESRVGSVVGLSGSLFAVRASLCSDFSAEQQSDFRTVLVCIRHRLRGVSDPSVIGYYNDVPEEGDEFGRKVRTMVRALTVFFKNADLLALWRYGLPAYELLCHKLLRWMVPWFLALAFISNAILISKSVSYFFLFIAQMIFYMGAAAGIRKRNNENFFLRVAAYFVRVNLSIAIAWIHYLKGRRIVKWEPTKR